MVSESNLLPVVPQGQILKQTAESRLTFYVFEIFLCISLPLKLIECQIKEENERL